MTRSDQKPKIFIGSSSEALDHAYKIEAIISEREFAHVYVWKEGVFKLSQFFLENLSSEFEKRKFDYGLFILAPDDLINSRGEEKKGARDNVILECGFFMGKLGYKKVFLVKPMSDVKIPSDLFGLNISRYDETVEDLRERLRPFCIAVQDIITEDWKNRKRNSSLPLSTNEISANYELTICNKAGDCNYKKTVTFVPIENPISERRHMVQCHASGMDSKKLKLFARGLGNAVLVTRIAPENDRKNRKEFTVHFPQVNVGQKYEYQVGLTWKKMCPADHDYFQFKATSKETSYTLRYPSALNLGFFKAINEDIPDEIISFTMENLRVKKGLSGVTFRFDPKDHLKNIRLMWMRRPVAKSKKTKK